MTTVINQMAIDGRVFRVEMDALQSNAQSQLEMLPIFDPFFGGLPLEIIYKELFLTKEQEKEIKGLHL